MNKIWPELSVGSNIGHTCVCAETHGCRHLVITLCLEREWVNKSNSHLVGWKISLFDALNVLFIQCGCWVQASRRRESGILFFRCLLNTFLVTFSNITWNCYFFLINIIYESLYYFAQVNFKVILKCEYLQHSDGLHLYVKKRNNNKLQIVLRVINVLVTC